MIAESYRAVVKHLKMGDVNWPMVIYIGLAHIAGNFHLYSSIYNL